MPHFNTAFRQRAQRLTVLVADDHILVRDGIKLLVADILGVVTFLEAGDGDSLMRAARDHPGICLALVDLNMPGMERGYRLTELARAHPELPLMVVSALTSPDVVRRTLDIATVFAFVLKSATSQHMQSAIEATMHRTKLPFAAAREGMCKPDAALTPRLEEVRNLVRQGMSNKRIAGTLGITEGTVKNHMTEMFKLLNVSNRTQAARLHPDVL